MKIIKNVLLPEELRYVKHVLNQDRWGFGYLSTDPNKPIWNFDKESGKPVAELLVSKINYELSDWHINGQTFMLDGAPHTDVYSGCTTAAVFFPYEWHPSWGGLLHISNDSVVLCQILPEQANFGTSNTQTFCIQHNSLEEPFSLPILIYPNPAFDKVTIASDGINIQQVRITDLSGHIIQKEDVYNKQITLDVSFISKGIYFIHILTEKGSALRKLIIK